MFPVVADFDKRQMRLGKPWKLETALKILLILLFPEAVALSALVTLVLVHNLSVGPAYDLELRLAEEMMDEFLLMGTVQGLWESKPSRHHQEVHDFL